MRRETCSPEEFEELVQRNMAANCGLDFRAAAEFVGCIAARELRLIRQPASSRQQRLMHLFNLQRALPVLEGLLAGLDSCCQSSIEENSERLGLSRDGGLAKDCGSVEGCEQYWVKSAVGNTAMSGKCVEGREEVDVSLADVLGCKNKEELVQMLCKVVSRTQDWLACECLEK